MPDRSQDDPHTDRGSMVLLHGFIKKSEKTPDKELEIADKRMRGLK